MTEQAEYVVYAAIAAYGAKEFLVPLVRGSFARNVAAADDRAKKVDTRLDDHDKVINELKVEKISTSQMAASLGEIKGQLNQLDNRIAEQGKYHDQKLVEALSTMATDFNHKLATTLNVELERTVRQVVREELQGRRRK